ncbi:MAG: SIMPL domain-containing protein [Patescibacteria group bacterium]|nr:MAG: SIMPL domain-containing protein [Patescibacteria group bacterium]
MPGKSALWNLLLATAVVYLGVMAANAYKENDYIGRPDASRDTIAISAEGKVTALPDIATVSVGVQTDNRAVSAAQKENSTKMNAIIEKVKSFGVAAEDIKTSNYSIYPQYDYVNGRQVERGFMVTQNIDVKVRNLDAIGEILAAAGDLGANQVGGVSFTIDEPEDLRQQARLKALEAAKKKAQALADASGVKLGKVVGFSENEGYVPSPMYYAKDAAMGMGGGAAPSISSGSQDVIVNVTVLYEILP